MFAIVEAGGRQEKLAPGALVVFERGVQESSAPVGLSFRGGLAAVAPGGCPEPARH